MNKFFGFVSLFLMSLFLSHCSSKTESIQPATNTVSAIPAETKTSTFLPAPTSSPSVTITPLHTPTPTSSPTIIITPIHILTEEQQANQLETIRELLTASFPDCGFPCFWGITPGKTSWLETMDFLIRNRIAFYEFKQAADYFGSGWQMFEVHAQKLDKEILGLDIYFFVYKNIVQHINIGDYYGTSGNAWRITWATLSPEKMIRMLGKPSRVQIYGGCGGGEGAAINDCGYALYVFYDARGVYLHYSLSTNLGDSAFICPTFGDGGNVDQWFKIILKSPEDLTPIEKYDEGYHSGFSFEEATGKTLEDFYQLFLQKNSPPCFRVLSKFFSP